ncbi:MAG: DMT family transporter [Candidatus Dormibacteria bacterium]
MPPTPSTTKGFLALTLASVIWGGMYVASDALMRRSPPFLVLELREGIALLILLTVAWRRHALTIARQDWVQVAIIGIVGFTISVGFQFLGTHAAGAALGSLVTASSPILIAVLGALVLHEQVPTRRWVAIAIAVVGVAVIVGTPAGGPRAEEGVLLLLVAAAAWALYTIGSRRLLERYQALTVVTWATAVGALTSLPLAAYATMSTSQPWPQGLVSWGEVLYIGAIGMAAAFFLWIWGFRSVPASRGGVLLLFQPLVGVALGVALLGEAITLGTVVGAITVAAGVVLAVWEPRAPDILGPFEA